MWAVIKDYDKVIKKLGYTPIIYSFDDMYENLREKLKSQVWLQKSISL